MENQCFNCGNIFDIPEEYIGKNVKCQKCEKTFLVKKLVLIQRPKKSDDNKTIEDDSIKWNFWDDLLGNKKIICPNPNCGYKGYAKTKNRGSLIIGLFLCLFFLLPGILYLAFKSGQRYSCPKCGLQIACDN